MGAWSIAAVGCNRLALEWSKGVIVIRERSSCSQHGFRPRKQKSDPLIRLSNIISKKIRSCGLSGIL